MKEKQKILQIHANLQVEKKIDNAMVKKKNNRQTKEHKTQHRNLTTEQQEPYQNLVFISYAPVG